MAEVVEESSVDPKLLAREVRPLELEDFATLKDAEPHLEKVLRDYFHEFCAPVYDVREDSEGEEHQHQVCPACGQRFTGLMASIGYGVGIEWGLVHGEGYCSGCRWPYRGHHFVRDPDGLEGAEPLLTVHNFFCAYLPRNVRGSWRPPEREERY